MEPGGMFRQMRYRVSASGQCDDYGGTHNTDGPALARRTALHHPLVKPLKGCCKISLKCLCLFFNSAQVDGQVPF